jgi:single-stranded-DNA-specific exonuclease
MIQPPAKNWVFSPALPADIDVQLSGFPLILRQILVNRGINDQDTAKRFLAALPPDNDDPGNMLGIPESVDRIQWAIKHHENIVIYGDYDADGVTATVLLSELFRNLNANVQSYIPNRFDEGYGLNNEALSSLKKQGANLVISVDCGIRSFEEAELSKRMGLDLIITDHHHPGETLPRALTIINPKQRDCPYPDKNLAGVGIAFKLATAITTELRAGSSGTLNVQNFLDLVALGTIADMAPLTGENRYFVKAGLKEIRAARRQGIRSLIGVSDLSPQKISSTDIGFMLGPRLNAAGRLESAMDALQLLSSHDANESGILAQKLNNQNRERQEITNKILVHAMESATARDPNGMLLIAVHPDYNPGVVGLVASRLTEKYYRPAIIAHRNDEYTRGSCRSIPEFHITNALDECADLLERHGGHAAAAGFTIKNMNWEEFVNRLLSIARRELAHLELHPTIRADSCVRFTDLNADTYNIIQLIQPTGMNNPPVIFGSVNIKVLRSWAVGRDSAHLKLKLSDGTITYDAIAFRLGHLMNSLTPEIDLLYTFEVNEYNGNETFQLNVLDIRPSGKAQ